MDGGRRSCCTAPGREGRPHAAGSTTSRPPPDRSGDHVLLLAAAPPDLRPLRHARRVGCRSSSPRKPLSLPGGRRPPHHAIYDLVYIPLQVPRLKHLHELFLRRRRRGLFVADPHVTVSSAPFPCFWQLSIKKGMAVARQSLPINISWQETLGYTRQQACEGAQCPVCEDCVQYDHRCRMHPPLCHATFC